MIQQQEDSVVGGQAVVLHLQEGGAEDIRLYDLLINCLQAGWRCSGCLVAVYSEWYVETDR